MEMIKTTGFCEMSADEMQKTDGGLDPVGLFGLMLALGYMRLAKSQNILWMKLGE